MRPLYLTNTLSRTKELFKPINPGHVGMYVCGPTVYGDAHLGHARPGVTYDVLFRLLKALGYKVRYVGKECLQCAWRVLPPPEGEGS